MLYFQFRFKRNDVSKQINDVIRASHLVLAAPTYNNGLYPKMANFIEDLAALNVQNRRCALIENGSWAPQSGKIMAGKLAEMKDMELLAEPFTLRSAMKESQMEALDKLAKAILATL